MSKDKGMSTVEFARYYEKKRFEFLKLTEEQIKEQTSENPNLGEQMNKLIEVVNTNV